MIEYIKREDVIKAVHRAHGIGMTDQVIPESVVSNIEAIPSADVIEVGKWFDPRPYEFKVARNKHGKEYWKAERRKK